jgi:hypothetical protein
LVRLMVSYVLVCVRVCVDVDVCLCGSNKLSAPAVCVCVCVCGCVCLCGSWLPMQRCGVRWCRVCGAARGVVVQHGAARRTWGLITPQLNSPRVQGRAASVQHAPPRAVPTCTCAVHAYHPQGGLARGRVVHVHGTCAGRHQRASVCLQRRKTKGLARTPLLRQA